MPLIGYRGAMEQKFRLRIQGDLHCQPALKTRNNTSLFSIVFSGIRLHSHCTEIPGDEVRAKVCPGFQCKVATVGSWGKRMGNRLCGESR
jgi:hypothetical protein